jgi:hypothetical protein
MSAFRRKMRRYWDLPLGLAPGQKVAFFILVYFTSLFIIASLNEAMLYFYTYRDFESFLFTGEIFSIFHVSSPFVWIWGALVALWIYRRPKD